MSSRDRVAPAGAADAYPLGPRTSGSLAWWGTAAALMALLSMLVTLLFARVYLLGAGDHAPPLLLPAVAAGLLLASAVPAGVAHRAARSGDHAVRAVGALVGTALLGAGSLAVQVASYGRAGLDPTASAAEATFAVTVAFHHLLTGVGLAALVVTSSQLVAGPPRARNRSSVIASVLLWQTLVWSWPFVVAVLYLLPRWA